MNRIRLLTLGFVTAALVVGGGAGLAHLGRQQQVSGQLHRQSVVVHSSSTAKAPARNQPTTSVETNGLCTTTTTSDVNTTPPDTHNTTNTQTFCKDGSSTGSSVNITNNSSQTSVSGGSTTSGNASNSDSTSVKVSN